MVTKSKDRSDEVIAGIVRALDWCLNPNEWVKDYFGNNILEEAQRLPGVTVKTETGLSLEQENALVELGKLIKARIKNHHKLELDEEEKIYLKKVGISIMAGRGVGKDFFAALCTWFFLCCFENAKVFTTANNEKQLKNVLWSELSKICALSKKIDPEDSNSDTILKSMFVVQSEKIHHKNSKERWFAEAVTAPNNGSEDEQKACLGGRHAPYMLFVLDEANGLSDGIYKPLEGSMTGLVNLALIIFNPTRKKGFAYDSQYGDKDRWVALRWDAEFSEIVNPVTVERTREKYGEDSNTWRINIKGLPPIEDQDTLIPSEWIEDALVRELEPLEKDPLIGYLDCGAGGDRSILCFRRGGFVYKLTSNNDVDPMKVVKWACDSYDKGNPEALTVDVIGVGHGIYGRLKELRSKIFRGDSRSSASDDDRFDRKRDECHWRLREAFESGTIQIPYDQELIDELRALKYELKGKKIKIIDKKKVRKELGHSPDKSDSLAGTYYYDDCMFRNDEDDEDDYDREINRIKTWLST